MSIAQLLRAFNAVVAPVALVAKFLGTRDQPSGSSFVGLGNSISFHQDTAVVGAEISSQIATYQGAARVYFRSNGSWQYQQLILDSSGATYDYFGHSVAVYGDTLAVGAYSDDHTAADSGSVSIYTRSGATWTLQQKISPSIASSKFGWSVSLHGDTLVVGSPNEGAGATQTGAVYIYTRTGSTWSLQRKIVPSVTAWDNAGTSVSLSANTLVIGIPNSGDEVYASYGRIEVWTRSGTTWALQQSITPPPIDPYVHNYGNAVSVDGDSLVIGHGSSRDMPVHVYTRTGSVWTLQQTLMGTPLNAVNGAAKYGHSVCIQGDRLVVGAYGETLSGANYEGCAFIYKRTGNVWGEGRKVNLPASTGSNTFGVAVAVYGDTALIGAAGDTDLGGVVGSGSVSIYNLTD